ncbi:MAG: hypothetical protein AABX33_09125 [Nanoarchaeota archaeon]
MFDITNEIVKAQRIKFCGETLESTNRDCRITNNFDIPSEMNVYKGALFKYVIKDKDQNGEWELNTTIYHQNTNEVIDYYKVQFDKIGNNLEKAGVTKARVNEQWHFYLRDENGNNLGVYSFIFDPGSDINREVALFKGERVGSLIFLRGQTPYTIKWKDNGKFDVKFGSFIVGHLTQGPGRPSSDNLEFTPTFQLDSNGLVRDPDSQKINGLIIDQNDGNPKLIPYQEFKHRANIAYYIPGPRDDSGKGPKGPIIDGRGNLLLYFVKEDGRIFGIKNRFFGKIISDKFLPAYTARLNDGRVFDINFNPTSGLGEVYSSNGAILDYIVRKVGNVYNIEQSNGLIIGSVSENGEIISNRQSVGYVSMTDFFQDARISLEDIVRILTFLTSRTNSVVSRARISKQEEFPGESFGEPSLQPSSSIFVNTPGEVGGGFTVIPRDPTYPYFLSNPPETSSSFFIPPIQPYDLSRIPSPVQPQITQTPGPDIFGAVNTIPLEPVLFPPDFLNPDITVGGIRPDPIFSNGEIPINLDGTLKLYFSGAAGRFDSSDFSIPFVGVENHVTQNIEQIIPDSISSQQAIQILTSQNIPQSSVNIEILTSVPEQTARSLIDEIKTQSTAASPLAKAIVKAIEEFESNIGREHNFKPEYAHSLNSITLSFLGGNPDSFETHLDIINQLPQYTQIKLFIESNSDIDLIRLNIPDSIFSRITFLRVLLRQRGSVWAQDFSKGDNEVQNLPLTYLGGGQRKSADNPGNEFMYQLESTGVNVQRVPVEFAGGNVIIARNDEGKKILFNGADDYLITYDTYKEIGASISEEQYKRIMKDAFNVDEVVIVGVRNPDGSLNYQNRYIFHLDQSMLPLSDGLVAMPRIERTLPAYTSEELIRQQEDLELKNLLSKWNLRGIGSSNIVDLFPASWSNEMVYKYREEERKIIRRCVDINHLIG